MRCCAFACVLLHLLAASLPCAKAAAAPDDTIFRSGDELVIHFKDLDLLRQANRRLAAAIRLTGEGGEKRFALDVADPVTPESIVIDLAGYGALAGVSLEIKAGDQTVRALQASPVPVVAIKGDLAVREGQFAAIETGTAMGPAAPPRIALPDAAKLRQETLAAPQRSVTTGQITYPVVTGTDLPVLASANYVLVSRQSSAPDDPTRCSLYFSYRKAVYDAASARLKGWRKFLVEVPLQRAWLQGAGDQLLTLPLDAFAVHATEERAPRGVNMLGEGAGGLAQGGQSADTDPKGRIYFTNVGDGAGLVRFNPHTRRFEQPPVDFDAEIRKLIPAEGDWRRGWDTALGQILCDRGRVYILFARNYRVRTPNGNFEVCSGMISLPQEGWDDAAAFRADIRLHAGSWAGAKHRLYDSEVPVGVYTRKMAAPMATTHGIVFASASGCEGGPWRLDLDGDGNTLLLAAGIKSTKDTVAADGTPLRPTEILTVNGLRKQQVINVGSAGRKLIQFNYGEFEITQAALALTLPGAPKDQLVDADGRYRLTYEGAPAGTLTVRFDIASKLKADSERYGELASSLAGVSLGPNYCVTPIPGEPDQAIGVCEYGYHLSRLDFSRRATDRKVFKTYLPFASGGEKTSLPAGVGLGPYNAAWAEHDDATWLYLTGYTGMTRLKYAAGGRPLEAFAADMFHLRLAPHASDARPRDSVKDYLHIVPAIDGRMIDIGRGRPGRGGGAYSAGLELFDPRTLGKSQTLVHMNRCFNLYTPASRLVLSAAGAPARQEVYAASGTIRQEYVLDIAEPAELPANREPKIFVYDCPSGGSLRDLYGFSLPESSGRADNSGNIAFSPCRQFLVFMQGDGCIYSYSVAQRRFIDGLQCRNAAGEPVQPIEFSRPSAHLWAAPTGQIFFLAALEGPKSQSASFFEVTISTEGRLAVRPHLAIACGPTDRIDGFRGIVRCFLPDLPRMDGSYDFVLAGDPENGQATVRVIEDFVLPRPAAAARALP